MNNQILKYDADGIPRYVQIWDLPADVWMSLDGIDLVPRQRGLVPRLRGPKWVECVACSYGEGHLPSCPIMYDIALLENRLHRKYRAAHA